ncbi:hypothetical protein RUMTOR_01893 [[Ruminococcus] torques ATCC 27756]|uniref:Uncharacterized protein n=1 Tax=[Ruminococcus] torques ATCC 27756 TaxID=411460 RepID=A5KNR8_9FIRM|nr:hypothetical protein RUMTOR_01893 [[Ruminococcus] torques ATCC 27756]
MRKLKKNVCSFLKSGKSDRGRQEEERCTKEIP